MNNVAKGKPLVFSFFYKIAFMMIDAVTDTKHNNNANIAIPLGAAASLTVTSHIVCNSNGKQVNFSLTVHQLQPKKHQLLCLCSGSKPMLFSCCSLLLLNLWLRAPLSTSSGFKLSSNNKTMNLISPRVTSSQD